MVGVILATIMNSLFIDVKDATVQLLVLLRIKYFLLNYELSSSTTLNK